MSRNYGSLVVLIAICTSPLLLTPAAEANPDESLDQPEYSDTSPLVIPAAAFRADGFDSDSFFFTFGGGYLRGGSQTYGCVEAEAALPDGFVIKEVSASVFDNDATWSIVLDLRRVDNFFGTGLAMARVSTSGTSTNVQVIADSTVRGSLVQYPDYSYYLTTCLTSSDLRLYSVQVYYASPEIFDDGFESGNTSAWSSTVP